MHLQVHHIVERSQYGTDDPDNLIATCLNCHGDAHTRTRLTRQFTVAEQKLVRDKLYQLVDMGCPPSLVREAIFTKLGFTALAPGEASTLSDKAAELLTSAALSEHRVIEYCGWPNTLNVEGQSLIEDKPHEVVEAWNAAFKELLSAGYVEHCMEDFYKVSHAGYLVMKALTPPTVS